MWIVRGTSYTDAGTGRHRNQDACFVDDELALYAVADGFGGHPAGDVASGAAVAALHRTMRGSADELARLRAAPDTLAATRLLEAGMVQACSEVHAMGTARPEWGGMCSSLTALLILGERAIIGHVGNCRVFLSRGTELHQLTREHTLAAELARSGALVLDPAEDHPLSHVLTRAIGSHEAVLVDTLVVELLRGDRLVLCTRGPGALFDRHRSTVKELLQDLSIEALPEQLANRARELGTTTDLTVIAVAGPAGPEVTETSDTLQRLHAVGTPFLFEALTLPQLTHVLNACTMTSYLPGEVVISEGAPLHGLLVGLDGRFELVRGDEDVQPFGAGDHVGATALLVPRQARATLRAHTAGRVLTLDAASFRTLIKKRPELGTRLMERLATRMSRELDALWVASRDPARPDQLL